MFIDKEELACWWYEQIICRFAWPGSLAPHHHHHHLPPACPCCLQTRVKTFSYESNQTCLIVFALLRLTQNDFGFVIRWHKCEAAGVDHKSPDPENTHSWSSIPYSSNWPRTVVCVFACFWHDQDQQGFSEIGRILVVSLLAMLLWAFQLIQESTGTGAPEPVSWSVCFKCP